MLIIDIKSNIIVNIVIAPGNLISNCHCGVELVGMAPLCVAIGTCQRINVHTAVSCNETLKKSLPTVAIIYCLGIQLRT